MFHLLLGDFPDLPKDFIRIFGCRAGVLRGDGSGPCTPGSQDLFHGIPGQLSRPGNHHARAFSCDPLDILWRGDVGVIGDHPQGTFRGDRFDHVGGRFQHEFIGGVGIERQDDGVVCSSQCARVLLPLGAHRWGDFLFQQV